MKPNRKLTLVFIRGLIRDRRHWYGFVEKISSNVPSEWKNTLRYKEIDLPVSSNPVVALTELTNPDKVINDLAEELPSGPFFVVSVSLGALVSLQMFRRFPTRMVGLVMINSSHPSLSRFYERIDLKSGLGILKKVVEDPLLAEQKILDLTVNKRHIYERLKGHMTRKFDGRPWTVLQLFSQLLLALSCKDLPSEFSDKILILASENDRLVPSKNSKRIASKLGATIRLHNTAGHDLTSEDPEWCIKKILHFLKSRKILELADLKEIA